MLGVSASLRPDGIGIPWCLHSRGPERVPRGGWGGGILGSCLGEVIGTRTPIASICALPLAAGAHYRKNYSLA